MRARGFTLVEMLVALAVGLAVLATLTQMARSAGVARDAAAELAALERNAAFALERLARSVRGTRRVLVPQRPSGARDVLAMLLDPKLDLDGDGFADADNDRNGIDDDDLPADETNDGAPGIVGIDDDGNGQVDNGTGAADNDERGTQGAVPVAPKTGADWLDVVLYRVVSGQLLERMPNLNPVNGNDFTERVVATNVSAFSAQLLPLGANRAQELRVTLTLATPSGAAITRTLRLRLDST